MSDKPLLGLVYLADRLREYASLFQTGVFPTVASILNETAKLVESGNVTQELLDETYGALEKALQQDYFQGISWRKNILGDVDSLLRKRSPKFERALEILKRTQRPQETFLRILSVATGQTDDLTQLYLLCFLYLVLIEGVYDEDLRFLYALYRGLPSSDAEIRDIKVCFDREGIGQSLFDGWNLTVRNGIAHATFSLDTGSHRAYFEDRRSNKSENLSFEDFRTMAQKIFDVGVAIRVLLIVRVLVLMNFHEVLRNVQTWDFGRHILMTIFHGELRVPKVAVLKDVLSQSAPREDRFSQA